MAQERMNIASMHVSSVGFRCPEYNIFRQSFLHDLIDYLALNQADLLILPAGYFTVDREFEAEAFISPVIKHAAEYEISLVIGVDLTSAGEIQYAEATTVQQTVQSYKMPCFNYVYNASEDSMQVWRQRSFTSRQAELQWTSSLLATEPRLTYIYDTPIDGWLCGECYDRRTVDATISRKPKAVYINGHLTMSRFVMTMKRLRRSGLSIIQSEHRPNPGGLHVATSCYKDLSHRDGRFLPGDNELWADISLWSLLPGRRGITRSPWKTEITPKPGESRASC